MKECPMKYTKNTADTGCKESCAWFIPPVMSDKEGGCAINVLAIASLLQNTFTSSGKTPFRRDKKKN